MFLVFIFSTNLFSGSEQEGAEKERKTKTRRLELEVFRRQAQTGRLRAARRGEEDLKGKLRQQSEQRRVLHL